MSHEREVTKNSKEVTVKLEYPFKFGEIEVSELTFRRPKAKDLKDIPAENLKFGDILKVMSRIANQPPVLMEELDAGDLKACAAVVAGFLGSSQTTGDNP